MKKLNDLAAALSCLGEEELSQLQKRLTQDGETKVLVAGNRVCLVWQGEKLLQEEFGSYELGAPKPRREIPHPDSLTKLWQRLLQERLKKVI